MQLKAGELSFHVLESGSGEPALLFLHYWGGSARTWNAVISQLSPDFRCIAYDSPRRQVSERADMDVTNSALRS